MASLQCIFVCTLAFGICLIWLSSFVLEDYTNFHPYVRHQNESNNINPEYTKDIKAPLDLTDRKSYHRNPCILAEASYQIQSHKCLRNKPKQILTGDSEGRLGNQMFAYATLISIAQRSNRSMYMSPSMSNYISKFFDVPTKTIDEKLKERIRWNVVSIQSNKNIFELKFQRKLQSPHIKLIYFLQLYKYFHDIRPIIRQHLKFYDDITQKSKALLRAVKNEFNSKKDPTGNFTLVGVHVRRGDYPNFQDQWKFVMPTIEFYKGAMKYFNERYKNVIFVVSTNENDTWFKTNLSTTEFQIYHLDGALEDEGGLDMAILVECDHLIFGLGTFGWWAGYLGRGEVVYCSDCNRPDSATMIMWDDDYANFVLPEWIRYSIIGTKTEWSALPKKPA